MITAVVALYAFVLQAVLGGLAPLPSAAGHGGLCLGQNGGEGTDWSGAGTPDPEHPAHPPCCTVPGSVLFGPMPEAAIRAVAWPAGEALRRAWGLETRVAARGPPGTIPHPRGPPVV